MTGRVFDIQEMTVHDGPGVRITFFLKGCPLRCAWCHNPEGQSFDAELMYKKARCTHCLSCKSDGKLDPSKCPTGALTLCGFEMSADEIVNRVLPLKETLELLEGGVTFSGGEPCAQPEFLLECLSKLKQAGIHTAIETSGFVETDLFLKIIDLCDVILMDLKLMDERLHQSCTGVSNALILENAKVLMHSGKEFIFRTPLIEGITDTQDNLNQIHSFLQGAPWEKIPSNPMAAAKYEQLHREYPLKKTK